MYNFTNDKFPYYEFPNGINLTLFDNNQDKNAQIITKLDKQIKWSVVVVIVESITPCLESPTELVIIAT